MNDPVEHELQKILKHDDQCAELVSTFKSIRDQERKLAESLTKQIADLDGKKRALAKLLNLLRPTSEPDMVRGPSALRDD